MTTAAVERLAARLVGLEKQVRGLSLPQLGYSTIEGGGIEVVDDEGNPTGTIGNLPDGSGADFMPVNGQRPPVPSAPILTKVSGGLKVEWDGTFADGAIVPINFSRVEVHVGDASGFYDGSAIWMRGTIESPRGGAVVVIPLAKEPKYAVLVARSKSGLASFASVEVSATPGGFFTDEDQAFIDSELAANAEALAANDVAITKLNTDLAANTATQNQLKVDLDANEAAVAAAKARADAAVAAASQAQTTADGKGKVHYTTAPPTASSTFDVWFDTDNDNLPHRWDGSTWVAQPLGNAAIGNLTAAKITTGEMSGARISAGTLDAGKITTGTLDANRVAVVNLNAGNITSGTINAAVIGVINLSASNITSGQINAANIAVVNINASNITAGTMHTDRLTGKTITSDRIFANTITSASGVVANLSADHLTAGVISADRLDANSLAGRTITGGIIQTAWDDNTARVIISPNNGASTVRWRTANPYPRNADINLSGSSIDYSLNINGPWDNYGGEWIRLDSVPGRIRMGVYASSTGSGGDILTIQNIDYANRVDVNGRVYASDGFWQGTTRLASTSGNPIFLYTGSNTRVATTDSGVIYMQNIAGNAYRPVYGGAYSNLSTGAAKKNVRALPKGALSAARALRHVEYDLRSTSEHVGRGLIAEEVRKVAPEVVTVMEPSVKGGETMLGLDILAVATLALQAVQELADEVADLRSQLEAA